MWKTCSGCSAPSCNTAPRRNGVPSSRLTTGRACNSIWSALTIRGCTSPGISSPSPSSKRPSASRARPSPSAPIPPRSSGAARTTRPKPVSPPPLRPSSPGRGARRGIGTPGPSLSPTPTMRPITCCWRWNPTTSPGRGFSSTSGWRCLWRSGSSACPACGGPLSSGTLRGPSWAWPTMPNASPPRGIRAASRPCPSMPRGRMR